MIQQGRGPKWRGGGAGAGQDAVTLAVVRPDFRAFASLPVRQAVSGVWRTHHLFLLTPDSLLVAFAAAGGGGGRIVGLGGTGQPFLEARPPLPVRPYSSTHPPSPIPPHRLMQRPPATLSRQQ